MTFKTITVLVKEEFQDTLITKVVKDLKEKQSIVKGLLECIELPNGIDIWFNEDGIREQMPLNVVLIKDKETQWSIPILGPAFFAGMGEEGEMIELSTEQKKWIKENIYIGQTLKKHRVLVVPAYENA